MAIFLKKEAVSRSTGRECEEWDEGSGEEWEELEELEERQTSRPQEEQGPFPSGIVPSSITARMSTKIG